MDIINLLAKYGSLIGIIEDKKAHISSYVMDAFDKKISESDLYEIMKEEKIKIDKLSKDANKILEEYKKIMYMESLTKYLPELNIDSTNKPTIDVVSKIVNGEITYNDGEKIKNDIDLSNEIRNQINRTL